MQQIKRILIDNSGYSLLNFGDVAMLIAAVNQLKQRFPDADIRVFTDAPDRLGDFIPSVTPVSLDGRRLWLATWNILGGLHKLLPATIYPWLQRQESLVRLHFPIHAHRWTEYRLLKRGYDLQQMHTFVDEVAKADMVIATGGGYITDSFENHAISLLQTLALAQSLGKPTALFGQGLGPVASKQLLAFTKKVLPRLDYITLRESRFSKPFALSVGMPPNKIHVTGDDAIALSHVNSPQYLGNAIGVNLRIADYSGLQTDALDSIRQVLTDSTVKLGAELRAVPISLHTGDSDLNSIRLLLGDKAADSASQIDTPEKVVRQIGQCRMVVTGSYHAGVFALSQGIGVVGVAASDYYRHKFEGLADQFAGGCTIVDRDKLDFEDNLLNAIQESWIEAEIVRQALLNKAQEQIKSAENAYDSFTAILEKN